MMKTFWIHVNIEYAGVVEPLLDDWKYKKKTERDKKTFRFEVEKKSKSNEWKVRKDFDELLWKLYSLDL